MSADRWGACPKCSIEYEAETERLQSDLDAQYGKVPPEQYIRLVAEQEKRENSGPEETMREDWYIGTADNGKFSVNYSCNCRKCGFSFKYDFEKDTLNERS